VAAVLRVGDAEEAVALANDTPFGLGARLDTDRRDGARVAGEIEAGWSRSTGWSRSDPRLPFGGVKRSGYGRELSVHGIREFVNIKRSGSETDGRPAVARLAGVPQVSGDRAPLRAPDSGPR
jgi:succinate-semialdehyde dehydrogenase / glutarate-semialdehyde dehydrogenase